MYELKLARPHFYRVKRGQTAEQISRVFGCPVQDCAEGDIIIIPRTQCFAYSARVGDSFSSVAAKFCADEAELEEINGGGAVYPTRVLYIPEGK